MSGWISKKSSDSFFFGDMKKGSLIGIVIDDLMRVICIVCTVGTVSTWLHEACSGKVGRGRAEAQRRRKKSVTNSIFTEVEIQ